MASGPAGGVVVAAGDGGHDLVLVAEELGQAPAGADRAGLRRRRRRGRVLAAGADEELVQVVDDAGHQLKPPGRRSGGPAQAG